MSAKTVKAFHKLVNAQQTFLVDVSSLTTAQLMFRPDEEHWNILQVIEHLVQVEKDVFLMSKSRLKSATSVDKAGPVSYVKYMIMYLVMNTSRRFQMPSGVREPMGKSSYAQLKKEWLDRREKWKTFVEGFSKDKNSFTAFEHPVFGPMSLPQTLGFLAEHTLHHRYQVARIFKHPDFPSSDQERRPSKQKKQA